MSDLHPALPPIPRPAGTRWPRPVTGRFALAAAFGVMPVSGLGFALAASDMAAVVLALCAYLAAAGLAVEGFRRAYPHGTVGLCNLVTLSRLMLSAILLVPLVAATSPWAVFAVAALALTLDGADGWLARRSGLTSGFGARFDMEVDSALALILAVNAYAAGTAGALVLLIGMPRYLFLAAALVLPWLAREVPERFSRKAVCVVQIATLIALQLPPVAAGLANPVVVAVALALGWSFGRDILWLWRTRS